MCTPILSSFLLSAELVWRADWARVLPLIVLNLLIHISGLELISRIAVRLTAGVKHRHPSIAFIGIVSATTLSLTCLHGIEAASWAFAYFNLHALRDFGSCMLYSLGAMTTYGHTDLLLERHWQLMGTLEALDGALLFGLSTAFLFSIFLKVRLSV
jgi:hypothetical protein